MSTIWQKFPGIKNLRERVDTQPIKAKFEAALAGGKYLFNSSVLALTLPHNRMGVLDGISFSSNIDQLTFSNAIDPAVNDGFFQLNLVRAGNGSRVNLAPFMFAAFSQGTEFIANFEPTGTKDGRENFNWNLTGSLLQTAALSGVQKISIFAVANIFILKSDADVKF
jgi:hypothetical protein